jgi:hypothetical protein
MLRPKISPIAPASIDRRTLFSTSASLPFSPPESSTKVLTAELITRWMRCSSFSSSSL